LAYASVGIFFIMWLLFGRYPPPISDDLSVLEPEMCSTWSFTSMLTTILPMSIGSPTGDLQTEQIALISQFKPEHRRKLWVLRMPPLTSCNARATWARKTGLARTITFRFRNGTDSA
jgi:hypothetical protein